MSSTRLIRRRSLPCLAVLALLGGSLCAAEIREVTRTEGGDPVLRDYKIGNCL